MKHLLLAALVLGLNVVAFAQQSFTISINTDRVEINGTEKPLSTNISEELIPNTPRNIPLYKGDNGHEYGVMFKYVHAGKRIKLIHRNYVRTPDGDFVWAKMKKDVQFIKVSIPGTINGKSRDFILTDKKALTGMKLAYDYSLTYR